MIKNNCHKYSVSALCKVLQVPRSTYYYEAKEKPEETALAAEVIDIFKASCSNYDTRKIKIELAKRDYHISRRRIGRIMKQEGLVSNYTVAQYKPHLNVVVSDLTYVRVGKSWNYICILVDLFNREIIGFSAGRNKDAGLVAKATFKVIKTEFVKERVFQSLDELKLELSDYVNWFNNHRIHSSLGYLTPYQYKLNHLKKVV